MNFDAFLYNIYILCHLEIFYERSKSRNAIEKRILWAGRGSSSKYGFYFSRLFVFVVMMFTITNRVLNDESVIFETATLIVKFNGSKKDFSALKISVRVVSKTFVSNA